MKIIVGLGNPEKDYKNTRHNVGFESIDRISADYKIAVNKLRFKSHIGEGHINNEKVILVKPQTYMNLSGVAVRDILSFYKLTNEGVIVIYDEANLDTGLLRIRERGSAGGHNGAKSIIQYLGTDEFMRIKIGIGEKNPS
ncbi:MAG: aminoacyl-tRNA hydrolase, partial [Clostridiales bacterium]|nr:aminoacyl-tRNA hydrolase [Clostridiales bacterium]